MLILCHLNYIRIVCIILHDSMIALSFWTIIVCIYVYYYVHTCLRERTEKENAFAFRKWLWLQFCNSLDGSPWSLDNVVIAVVLVVCERAKEMNGSGKPPRALMVAAQKLKLLFFQLLNTFSREGWSYVILHLHTYQHYLFQVNSCSKNNVGIHCGVRKFLLRAIWYEYISISINRKWITWLG